MRYLANLTVLDVIIFKSNRNSYSALRYESIYISTLYLPERPGICNHNTDLEIVKFQMTKFKSTGTGWTLINCMHRSFICHRYGVIVHWRRNTIPNKDLTCIYDIIINLDLVRAFLFMIMHIIWIEFRKLGSFGIITNCFAKSPPIFH